MELPARRMPEQPWSDAQIIARVLAGEPQLFELLMRRHNERIYRAVRAILRDEAEAEDAMQASYLHAYGHLGAFESRSAFATWMTRIAIHEALARRKRSVRMAPAPAEEMEDMPAVASSPEDRAADHEHRRLLSRAIDALPEHFRTVFVLRQVQELSIEETAACLDVLPQTVKTRLHRANALLRRALAEQLGDSLPRALPFEATRCDRVVAAVLERIGGGNLS